MRYTFSAWNEVMHELQQERDRLDSLNLPLPLGRVTITVQDKMNRIQHAISILQALWQEDYNA